MTWNTFRTKRLDTRRWSTDISDHILLNYLWCTGWDGHCVFVNPGAIDAFIWDTLCDIWLIPNGGSLDWEKFDTLD